MCYEGFSGRGGGASASGLVNGLPRRLSWISANDGRFEGSIFQHLSMRVFMSAGLPSG